ncbi:CHRD domain-containing protein (fragment) [Hyella patelloides LEGE 07179]|uniref:CHRD domain-containing protein n=1 Tax=Hyella patelloides LEGE 07179 TaxID=945734 RepID=A0A563W1J1_9CYAN
MTVTSELEPTIDLFRFRNTTFDSGTYIFVSEQERDTIIDNPDLNQIFELEGEQEDGSINPAFTASANPGEGLSPLYRFQSNITPGNYLFVGEQERQNIDTNFAEEFNEEGLAFYVYQAGSDRGAEFTRFQNQNRPGTYLFAGEAESANIRANFPNFLEEGVAFEAL